MKSILLIITLFISWNAIAEEKTWFCSTEERAGLSYEEGTWKVLRFIPLRMTVKQENHTLLFSNKGYDDANRNCNQPYPSVFPKLIACSGDFATFSLNTSNGLATSSRGAGWSVSDFATDNQHDSTSVSVWKCESF